MRFYRISDDWLTSLEGDFLAKFLELLKGLDLNRLQYYPPPKIGGLPFGNELRVLRRHFNGRGAQLDASALSRFYRLFASDKDALHYRAFRQNDKLSRDEWARIVGAGNVDEWVEKKFLRTTDDEQFICQFSVVGMDNLIFLIDPMNDHGNPVECVALEEGKYSKADISDDIQPFYYAYMGLDSLQMIVNMKRYGLARGGRYLDCGPGAGGLLLYFAKYVDEAVGIDLNPRAVKLARINARLNDLWNVKTFQDDALDLGDRYGKFDLVSWNLPFLFLPDEEEDEALESFGGEMGIGICMRFLEQIPSLIRENGKACVAALAPCLNTGENVLEERLKPELSRLGLDCVFQVYQDTFAHTRDIWHFHQNAGIKKSEAVYLYLTHGTGKMHRVEAPAIRKAVDVLREKMYRRKFA